MKCELSSYGCAILRNIYFAYLGPKLKRKYAGDEKALSALRELEVGKIKPFYDTLKHLPPAVELDLRESAFYLKSHSPAVLYHYLSILWRIGEKGKACRILTDILKVSPPEGWHPQLYKLAGLILTNSGQHAAALSILNSMPPEMERDFTFAALEVRALAGLKRYPEAWATLHAIPRGVWTKELYWQALHLLEQLEKPELIFDLAKRSPGGFLQKFVKRAHSNLNRIIDQLLSEKKYAQVLEKLAELPRHDWKTVNYDQAAQAYNQLQRWTDTLTLLIRRGFEKLTPAAFECLLEAYNQTKHYQLAVNIFEKIPTEKRTPRSCALAEEATLQLKKNQ